MHVIKPLLPALLLTSALTAGCATSPGSTGGESSSTGEHSRTFEVRSLANTITLPVSFMPDTRIMQETGLAFLMPDGRSVTIDTRSAEDFDDPVPMPDYPRYVLGLKEPSTDNGLTRSQVDELTEARGIITYGEEESKKVRQFDTGNGTGYVATTDGEAFVYLVMDGYSDKITEVYLWGFDAEDVERWVDEGRFH